MTDDPARTRMLLAELERRRRAYPLAWSKLWDAPEPATSQRRAVLLDATPDLEGKLPRFTAIFGANRSGKSEALAQWGIAQASGIDAYTETAAGRVEWVRRWLARNALPERMVARGPSRVWIGSPAFQASCEQIRPKLLAYAPEGTKRVLWDQAQQAELRIPTGGGRIGVVVSKAFAQYEQNKQTWEGAKIRAMGFDEQPDTYDNFLAGLSRLIDLNGRAMMALTPLRGKADWLYQEIVSKAPSWFRSCYLHGADNPHIPQEARAELLSMFPAWQRAARERGEFVDPTGLVYSIRRDLHQVPPFEIPDTWIRWRAIDWGERHAHVLWAAEVEAETELPDGRTLRSGDLVVYRELPIRQGMGEANVPAERLLEAAARMQAGSAEDRGVPVVYTVADSAEPKSIELANAMGWPTDGIKKRAGSVQDGLGVVEMLLQWQDPGTLQPVRPRLYITSDCPVLLDELIGLRWAEPRPGQEPAPDPRCSDHGPDALRYLCMYRRDQGFT